MPKSVVVTSANSLVGQQLIPVLKANDFTVTALTRQPFNSVADRHITNWTTAPEAVAAIEAADYVVHLSGEIFARTWEEFYQPNVATTEVVAKALRRSNARKVVFISYPGADARSSNLFLKSKGQAEQLLTQTGKNVVIFAVQSIIKTPDSPGPFEEYLTGKGTDPVRIIGNGRQLIRVVLRTDVVTAIMNALTRSATGHYDVFSESIQLDQLVPLINRRNPHKLSKTPIWLAKLFSRFSKDLSSVTVDLYARPTVAMDNTRAKTDLGVQFESVQKMWQV